LINSLSGDLSSIKDDLDTVKAFNEKVHLDKRVSNILVPVRDGMMLMIKN